MVSPRVILEDILLSNLTFSNFHLTLNFLEKLNNVDCAYFSAGKVATIFLELI